MKSVERFDVKQLGKAKKLDSGFLKAPVYATRTGVFTYYKADGTVFKEYRPEEEVFKQDSMNSLAGVPLTNRHPKESVNSTNAKKYTIGYTSDIISKEDKFVKTSVTITHQDMIDELERSTLREVSCGYTCKLEYKPGVTPTGEKYDAVQRDIVYNHLAIVDRGRAGQDVRLHLDSDDNMVFKTENTTPKKEKIMKANIKLDGVGYEVEATLAAPINNAIENAKKAGQDEVQAKMDATLEDTKKSLDELQAKFDTLEEESKKSKLDTKQINELVNERMSVVASAKKHLEEEIKMDEMDNLSIMKAVCEAKGIDLTDKSDIYVAARFDAITEGDKDEADKGEGDKGLENKMKKAATGEKKEDSDLNYEQLVAKKRQTDQDAWMNPIGYKAKN